MNTPYSSRCSFRLIILVSTFVVLPLAAKLHDFDGGSGRAENPYQVAAAEHLDAVRDHLDAYFIQIADIDLGVAPWNEGEGWVPIGWPEYLIDFDLWVDDPCDYPSEEVFTGNFQGNGHKIKNVTINRGTVIQGLFGNVSNSFWNTEISGITQELITEDSERETWKATAPVATRGFMRLQAVRE